MSRYVGICLRAAGAIGTAAAAPAAALDFSGSAALTSDYVLRGISQTQGDPALQVGVRATAANGFYASAWGSQIDYGPVLGTDAEVDLIAGWNRNLGTRWNLDLNLTRYRYPGTRGGVNLDYNEILATLTLDQRGWLLLGWSENVFASHRRGIYLEAGARFPLSAAFRFETIAAHYDLDAAYGRSYRRAQLSAIYTLGAVDLRASGHWTSDGAEQLFPQVAGSRFEIAALWNF